VLHVTADAGQAHPVLHWACAAEDLEHIGRDTALNPSAVQLLALAPPPRIELRCV